MKIRKYFEKKNHSDYLIYILQYIQSPKFPDLFPREIISSPPHSQRQFHIIKKKYDSEKFDAKKDRS